MQGNQTKIKKKKPSQSKQDLVQMQSNQTIMKEVPSQSKTNLC